jgi:hypothetical protein
VSRLPAVQQKPNRIGTDASLRPPLVLLGAGPSHIVPASATRVRKTFMVGNARCKT